MNAILRLQLSAMMFVQFFIWGAWYVTAPNYLGTIGFSGNDIGWTYAVGPIAGMISPFFVGMIADRFFATQRVLAVMHILGALFMLFATTLMRAQSPSPDLINVALFGYMLTYFPTLALTNTLAMKNVANPEKDFPGIRVWGTIGWIAANLALTQLAWEKSIEMFYLTGGASLVLGLFSFFLPHTPPVKEPVGDEDATTGQVRYQPGARGPVDQPVNAGKITARQILGLDAFILFKDRNYLVFMAASLLICIPLSFYYQITSRIVEMSGLPIGQTMSYGQMSEIFFMFVMPFFFARLGVKWMLAIGMLAWVVRYLLFSLGSPDEVRWMIILGITLHGICYDFFFVTGQIYTDRVAPKHLRAQAQGLLVLFTLGMGMAIGAKTAGIVEEQHKPAASRALAEQMVTKSAELEALRNRMATASDADRPAMEVQAKELEAEKTRLNQAALKTIEWKPLWGKPAIFAAVILILFVLLFKGRTPSASAKQAEVYAD